MAMASTYNSRPLPMEVLVDGDRVIPLRRPQTALDLTRDEETLGLVEKPSMSAEAVRSLFAESLGMSIR